MMGKAIARVPFHIQLYDRNGAFILASDIKYACICSLERQKESGLHQENDRMEGLLGQLLL